MNDSPDQRISQQIQHLAATNGAAGSLFTLFAKRQKDSRETSVERAARKAGVDYSSMLQVFRELDEIGVGRFIPGRHGHASRISWHYSIQSLGKIALGKGRKLDSVSPDAETEEPEASSLADGAEVEHEFQLRSDLKIKFALPSDLSEREAERLGAFLKTLPL